ncbi:hypothetical protein MPLSOD_110106 [Mesorhizobium sp. SOD10]|nr:hypothetical protein MPLSOD_110106 [Mesorhizobium sp. SOD10]
MTISPGFPQFRRLFGSLQTNDSETIQGRATAPTIEVEGKTLMNQHVSRRTAFAATTAIAASVIPFECTASETPDERAVRLAKELSEAMNGFMTPADGRPGWIAHIGPSIYPDPIWFSQDATEVRTPDPLLDAIAAFRASMADYEKNAPDDSDLADAYAEITYAPAMTVIEDWDQPATSKRGAVEALRLVLEEMASFQASPMVPPLVTAALAYLERGARSV